MKRRLIRIFVFVAVGLVTLTGVIFLLVNILGDDEPAFRGKTVYDWSEQLKTSSSNSAVTIIQQEIIPQLVKTMVSDTNDSTIRLWLIEKLNTLPGVNIYYRTADSRRQHATESLGEFGRVAEPAFADLMRSFQGQDLAVKGVAAESLGKIGAQPAVVIPLLIHALDDENLREDAADALGEFGPAAADAVPKLTTLLEVRDKELHRAVVNALQKISPPTKQQPSSAGQ